jgi:hypothetical protein
VLNLESAMKYLLLAAGMVLTVCSIEPASAAVAPFGCDARAPSVCHFRIFYAPNRGRNVVLRAGMKERIPDVEIGRHHYCVGVNAKPKYKCRQKVINGNYNN